MSMVSPSSNINDTMAEKRSIDQVDNDLLDLAAQQAQDKNDQTKKKRRRQYAPMTQYSNTQATEAQDEESSETSDNDCPAGYIKKIVLRNFMCHENFEMEFGPRLNFIVGNNGSGKSAILTAITVGLGAKASETNRGNSLKDLIKNGCYSTKITITLNNSAYGAYNPGVYGDEIIIERTIKRDGPASFSLKTENGKEISHKKKDIQVIIDYFSIPISNPMCFLSQDAARSFLTASTAQDKYNHFMKGTLLMDINNNLEHAKRTCLSANENMSLHLENLKLLKKDYEDAKKLVRQLDQTSTLNEDKRLLQGKSCWIDVEYNQKSVKKRENDIITIQKKLKELGESSQKRNAKIARYDADNRIDTEEIQKQNEEWKVKDQRHQEVKDQLREVRHSFDMTKENVNEAENKIKECNKKISDLDKNINHLKEEIKKRMGGDKEQMRVDMDNLIKKNDELNDLMNILSSEIQDLENKQRTVNRRRDEELKQIDTTVYRNRQELKKIREGNVSFLSNFDSRMETLLQQIQHNKNRFKTIPIGPLGNYVTVKDNHREWAPDIQKVLSSTLSSFVVSCPEDNRTLRQLIKSCGIRSNITITTYRKFEKYNIDSGRAQSNYPAIIDTLEFSKPELREVFIDLNSIEKVILIRDHNAARNFLKTNPRNVKMALSKSINNNNFGFQLSGGYRLDSVSYEQNRKLKVGSVADDGASYLEEQIKDATDMKQQVSNNYDSEMSEYKSKIHDKKKIHKDCNYNLRENTKNITRLRINLERTEDTGVLTSKENEKEKQEQAIVGYQSAIDGLNAELSQLKEQAIPIKNNYDATKKDLAETSFLIQQLTDKIEIRQRKIQKHKEDINFCEDKKDQYNNDILKIKDNIDRLQEGINIQRENAIKFATEEEVSQHDLPNDQEEIKKLLKKIDRMIKETESRLGMTQADILNHFATIKDQYKESYGKYRTIDEALVVLHESIDNRYQNYYHLKKHTCFEADMDFRKSIRIRNFAGNLVFIEDTKSLEIYILTPDDEKARNVDTLSGGEKSFSQMALLLATWKPMRSRIIALDEFDVFMDQVNRKIGTALIVKKLKDSTRTQTIIITPQDIGKIADIDKSGVQIHKMKDPERHNNSNFYQG